MDKFIRGSDGVDISIGSVKTEQLRDHKHLSTDHQHDLEGLTVDFSHNHDLSYDLHDISVNHHKHSIAMGYVNYSTRVIEKNLSSHVQIVNGEPTTSENNPDISLLIHPDSIIRNQQANWDNKYNVESITAESQGGGELVIAGHTKTVETPDIIAKPSDTNFADNYRFFSISGDEHGYDSGKHEFIFANNTFTDASRSYVNGACDVTNDLPNTNNVTHADISPEGYPTHLTMLPCISIGIVQGSLGEGDFDYESYSYQNRIRYLENRLDKMDKQMNTTEINIIGNVDYIQEEINTPTTWEIPGRAIEYNDFNYKPYIFNYDDSGNIYYFDFTRTTFNNHLAGHHRVLHKGYWYDISGRPTPTPTALPVTDGIDSVAYGNGSADGISFSAAYKILEVEDKIKIARYYPEKQDHEYTDISWTFKNPER
tara:strand:- start:455 stop:1732 length:1278 start_codon:yes stop_codon:yes gene_type:complete